MPEVTIGPAGADQVDYALAAAARGDEPVWMPSAGEPACRRAWERLARAGIVPAEYGTARARAGDPDAPRVVEATIPSPPAFGCVLPILVEDLGATVGARYVELGLRPARADQVDSGSVVRRLSGALGRLTTVPSLAEAAGRVLRVVHVAVPESDDYDVSYSDPEVPFSLWVGVGEGRDPTSELRLAEGLLHEAMHLQLSLVEACVPLIEAESALLWSPWRDELRPAGGVLHGAYVFAAIRDLMMALRDGVSIGFEERRHLEKRVATTGEEIAAALSSLAACRGLTASGLILVGAIARSLARTSLPSEWI